MGRPIFCETCVCGKFQIHTISQCYFEHTTQQHYNLTKLLNIVTFIIIHSNKTFYHFVLQWKIRRETMEKTSHILWVTSWRRSSMLRTKWRQKTYNKAKTRTAILKWVMSLEPLPTCIIHFASDKQWSVCVLTVYIIQTSIVFWISVCDVSLLFYLFNHLSGYGQLVDLWHSLVNLKHPLY